MVSDLAPHRQCPRLSRGQPKAVARTRSERTPKVRERLARSGQRTDGLGSAAASKPPAQPRAAEGGAAVINLFGSGPIFNEALRAQQILAERYGIAADVWSVTSYNELRREALRAERWNRLHPGETPRRPYVVSALGSAQGPIVAATDFMKVVPDQVAPWLPGRMVTLGTDGFGRSENREYLRRHFEVNAESIVTAALSRLARDGKFDAVKAAKAFEELGVKTEGIDPAIA